jgi:hypothetical protein
MFCPKCGTQNPESGKFCRTCGTDLSPVSDALSGKSANKMQGFRLMQPLQPLHLCDEKDKPPTWESALGKLFMGLAFLIVSIVLAFTGRANQWWFWMMIPAFAMLGSGIAQYIQIKKLEQKNNSIPAQQTNQTFAPVSNASLPQVQTDYIAPAESRYKTGDLVPPSVIEGTTRQLEINQEGETMTLPKK